MAREAIDDKNQLNFDSFAKDSPATMYRIPKPTKARLKKDIALPSRNTAAERRMKTPSRMAPVARRRRALGRLRSPIPVYPFGIREGDHLKSEVQDGITAIMLPEFPLQQARQDQRVHPCKVTK